MPPASITPCFSKLRKARKAASGSAARRSSTNADCSVRSTATAAGTHGIRRRRAARSTRTSQHSLGGPWDTWAMIAAYSPQAQGRSERAFRTHQDRLPKELALAGVTDMEAANRYLAAVYLPAFNQEFMQPAMEEGSAFVAWIGGDLDDILCEQFERGQRQLCALRRTNPADSRRPPPLPLRQGKSAGASVPGPAACRLPWPATTVALRCSGSMAETRIEGRRALRKCATGYAPRALPHAIQKADNLFATEPDNSIRSQHR